MPLGKNITRRVTPSVLTRKETTLGAVSPGRSVSITDATDYSETRQRRSQTKALASRSSRGHDEYNETTRRQRLTQFITDTFSRKECTYFVPNPPKPGKEVKPGKAVDKCKCGEILERHCKFTKGTDHHFAGRSAANNDLDLGKAGEEWSKDHHIREMTTNAFGEINFINEKSGGHKPAKFVRLADNSDIEEVFHLMRDEELWNMYYPFEPNLIITVIGGAKNFKLDGKKKEVFNRGLVEAAQSTHAWIITSGCNMGVMKAVGEAVEERQTYEWDSFGYTHKLRCIGIAPWGYVERNNLLLRKESSYGNGDNWHKTYPASNKIVTGQPVSLNANHTHFFLVDDGIRGFYQGSAKFRSALEKKLADLGKHVVLVVVEGGTDAIKDASESLKRNIPVVLCEGTGRAADILSFAYAYSDAQKAPAAKMQMATKHHARQLDVLLTGAYGKTWAERSSVEKELALYRDLVLQCCESKHLMSVFDMNKDEALDVAILAALLKGQGASEKDTNVLHKQLMLALTWNRSDIAEEQIFNKDISWPEGKLDDVMLQALRDDKVNFVRLLLNNGVTMKSFLTVRVLRQLYNSAANNHLFMYNMVRRQANGKTTLRDVHILLQTLKMNYTNKDYENDEWGSEEKTNEILFDQPFRELFIWAVLSNRHDMAKFLWERGEKCISSALAASQIYLSMSERVEQFDIDLKDQFLQNKEEFEHLAVKVLDECHYTHPENTAEILERKCPRWENLNCLQIAAQAQDKEFLSSVACQKVLNKAWNRGISVHWFKLGLCVLFPPLIWCLVDFDELDLNHKLNQPTPFHKLLTFFRAPVVKFTSSMIMYLMFVIAYSYMLLFEFNKEIGILETIILVWIFTMLVEEIREMFFLSDAPNVLERIKVWWSFSLFNRIDLLIILVSIIGFIFRINDSFRHAKTIYCINCVLFFVRVLSFYTASSYLGPKLVMIARMVQELLLYIMILVVFLLAYGVSTLALQYPTREPYWKVLRDIFYYPYWQIYGELFLEELEGRTGECDGKNATGIMSDGNPCPEFNWLVPALTALYLLIGNVLLLNLLIAIFTNVFEEVNTNSIQIWKYAMYFLVVEYEVKPSLAPPFVFLEHIVLGIQFLCRRCCCIKIDTGEENAFNAELLDIFEREMQKQYLMRNMRDETDNIELKINRIHHRVDEVTKLLKQDQLMTHQLSEGSVPEARPGLHRRVTSRGHAAMVRSDSEMSLLDSPYDQSSAQPTRPSTAEPPSNSLTTIPEQTYKESNLLTGNKPKKEPQFKNLMDTTEDPYASYNFSKLKEPAEETGYDHLPAGKGKQPTFVDKEEERATFAKLGPIKPEKEPEVQQPYNTESEEEEKSRKRRAKKKKKKKNRSYEVESEDMDSADDNKPSNHAPKPVPRNPVTTSREAFSAQETVPSGSDLERRLGDIETSTQAQLGNIEVLLRNMMFQSRVAPTAQDKSPTTRSRPAAIATPRSAFEAPGSDRDQSPQTRAFHAPPPPPPLIQPPRQYSGAAFENPAFQYSEGAVYTTGAPLGGGLRRPNTASSSTSQFQRGSRY